MRLLIIFFALAVASSVALAFQRGDVLSGIATAKDGDDVIVASTDIRLQGIAAPEDNSAKREPGGPESSANLRAFVDGKQVRCELDGTQALGQPVGICYLIDSFTGRLFDIGLHQVSAGHARDCPRYSGGRYAAAEAKAQAAGRNLSEIYALPSYCVPR